MLDVSTWNDEAFHTGNRLRSAHWVDDRLWWAGPRGIGILLDDGTLHFRQLTNRRAYFVGDDVVLHRRVDDRTFMVGYDAASLGNALTMSDGRDALDLHAHWTHEVSDRETTEAVGVARIDGNRAERGSHFHLQAYSSGRIEVLGGTPPLFLGAVNASSDIEEANELAVNTLAATETGDVVAVAREIVVSVYNLADTISGWEQ